MFDEMERLRDEKGLFALLSHYAALAVADRQVWQDRLLEMAGVEVRQLIRLHGELLAYGWLEQNSGLTPVLRRGEADVGNQQLGKLALRVAKVQSLFAQHRRLFAVRRPNQPLGQAADKHECERN